jgi:hypothetical protein
VRDDWTTYSVLDMTEEDELVDESRAPMGSTTNITEDLMMIEGLVRPTIAG